MPQKEREGECYLNQYKSSVVMRLGSRCVATGASWRHLAECSVQETPGVTQAGIEMVEEGVTLSAVQCSGWCVLDKCKPEYN